MSSHFVSIALARLTAAAISGSADQHEAADQLLPAQDELELAVTYRPSRIRGRWIRLVGPAIQTITSPAPYSTARDGPFEIGVTQGMVLHLHGQAPQRRVE